MIRNSKFWIICILLLSSCQISTTNIYSSNDEITSSSQITSELESNSSISSSDEISIESTITSSNSITSEVNSSFECTSSNITSIESESSSKYSSFNTSFSDNYQGAYYDGINLSLTKDALVRELSSLITSTHKVKSYDALWEGYILGDLIPNTNYLWDMYSNCKYDAYNPPKGNYSKEGDAVNREHSVPQSWFNEASPMKSDYYHVVPTDGYVNNRRSNYPFAEVDDNNIKYQSQNGSKLGTSKGNNITGTVFEPIDEYKGDFARIYFYMCTRYYEKVGSWGGNVFQSTYPYIKSNYFNLYLKWAKEDPVSAKEIARNEGGYQFQGNRNPYVDFPNLLFQAFDTDYVIIEKTDEEKANEIIELINQIGLVSIDSKSAIEKARTAYDQASDSVKQLITNYDVLLSAEEEYNNLVDSSSPDISQSITCTFEDASFNNNVGFVWECNVSPNGFENERGIQFLKKDNINLKTSSYKGGITSISLIVSSNQNTYTLDVSINKYNFNNDSNTITSGDKNVSLTFTSLVAQEGELSINITAPSQNKSFWIKSVIFN